ncbi:MAG: NifB/NifX family molybdenum-iron cluster-binding protein [Candidatus Omnitrophica bacterium]|nr:NifB/NifX family molybdenum-iron cluster-binding protein [Candidatus Omnitrophota bacterium]
MKICIPVKTNTGLKAKVNAHFGSSPYFLIYDIDNDSVKTIENSDRHHIRGACHPLKILENQNIDIVACRGIGARVVQTLNRSGIWAYRASGERAEEIITECKDGKLKAITIQNACTDHNCHASPPLDYSI